MRRLPALVPVLAALVAACPESVPENAPPVLTGPADTSVALGESVVLVATATDPDGDALTFSWEIAGRPLDSQPGLTGAQTASATFTPDREGEYVLTVVVSDGTHETEPAVVRVTAVQQPFLEGRLDVLVVDADSGAPIPGATVRIEGGALSATADDDGRASITDDALTGAITLHVTAPGEVEHDHDANPQTPAVTRPAYRGATIVGAVRASLTVPLQRTQASRAGGARGKVRGRIGAELYALLPEVAPMLSLVPSEVTSGQLRAVLVAPLPKKPLGAFEVSDLMGPPLAPDALLPGNLTTDDAFLNSVSALLGVPDLGDHSLEVFEVEAPAGRQKFVVLGVLISAEMSALVPLLTGAGTPDPGAILGSLEPLTLFAGIVELDVPAEGRTELAEPLSPANLLHVWRTPVELRTETGRGPWPLDVTEEVEFETVVVTPGRVAKAATPASVADPRLAGQLPDYAVVEITNPDGSSKRPKEYDWLTVPEETGTPATDVPFGVAMAVTRFEDALLPIGISFTRVGDRALPEAVFAIPKLDGPLTGASVETIALSMRGLRPAGVSRGLSLLPGVSAQVQELVVGATTPAASPAALPLLARETDQDLDTYVECLRDDTSTTEVRSARAYLDGVNEPARWRSGLGRVLSTSLPAGAHLAHVVVSHRATRTMTIAGRQVVVAFTDPAWDIYADAAGSLELALPSAELARIDSDAPVQIEVRAESYPAPLDMERWSGERLRSGPRVFSTDTWLGFWPTAPTP